ncbi:ubiquitin carboxyl-terminal hydrolase 35 isoform X2 [Epargyreus clarus]|uniref:ubiquitin carboxyl-terminal hydrolase 35 isoform X2 n=1 Tax=Epargyreus clarus TaxID=520877 RepID=UPI003C2D666F
MPSRRKPRKMAVKKHELVQPDSLQPDLETLEQYLQMMNEQNAYLPPAPELVKTCQDIVKCLSRASGNEEELWVLLQSVEGFLLRIMNTVSCEVRQEVVTAVMDKFYSFISDPQSDACPAMSTVLVVIDSNDTDASMNAARWLVQQRDNGPGGAGLRSSLSCLYRWMYEWHGTPTLGNWILSYVKALQESERFDILIEVSLDNLASMFSALATPSLRQSNANVIFHVLASLRESTDALDRISTHVKHVLTQLAADSGQYSRNLLQNIVDILSAMIDRLVDPLKGEAKNNFRSKYANVIRCLERHMASKCCRFLRLRPWRARNAVVPRGCRTRRRQPTRKVGLINLGNTCYMNSVMQALLLTRQFSTHVLLKMNGVPYWSKVGILFAKMLHSISTKLNPEEFFAVVKPPFFTTDTQHDSSEFLGYLFELLSSYEHCSDANHDYSRPAVLNSANRWRGGQLVLQSASDNNNHPGTSQNRRSVSPRPGSSAAGSSSSMKRNLSDDTLVPPKKRLRMSEALFLHQDSFIDSLFGGVLLTRVECTHCHSSSLSRDVFRDLQLAFPEYKNPDGPFTVQNLLDYYCSKESLSGDNKYQCADCGVLRDAERSVLIETTPKYLILVLKHFKFDAKMQVQTKLCQPMYHNSGVTLPTVRSQAVHSCYTLYAAVIHAGTTLDSGHYYTLAKDNDQWFMYNDDSVADSDESKLEDDTSDATPYILFYKRDDIVEPAAPSLSEVPPVLQEMVLAHNKHYVETVRQMHITRP